MNISRKRKGKKKTICWRTILVQSRSGCVGGSSPSAAFLFPPTTNRTVSAIHKEDHDNNQMCIHFGTFKRQVQWYPLYLDVHVITIVQSSALIFTKSKEKCSRHPWIMSESQSRLKCRLSIYQMSLSKPFWKKLYRPFQSLSRQFSSITTCSFVLYQL